MLSNRLAFAALAIACIGAAAGGGYLATRQNTIPTPASAQVQPTAPASVPERVTAPAAAVNPAAPAAPAKAVQEKTTASKASAVRPVEQARTAATRETAQAAPIVARQEPPAAQTSSATPQPPAAPSPATVESTPAAARADDRAAQEPARTVEPPARTFSELVVSAESVIGLQTENRVSSESARVEDRVEARVTRDVKVGDHVAIPAGARALGSVMQVERGGKFKERARLGLRFHTLVLADGTRIPISTETIFREGDPGMSSPSKVGGAAVGGAILGAILGGAKGMAIGAAAGAGAGTAAVAAGDRNAATLPAGTSMTVRILQPITVTTDSKH